MITVNYFLKINDATEYYNSKIYAVSCTSATQIFKKKSINLDLKNMNHNEKCKIKYNLFQKYIPTII